MRSVQCVVFGVRCSVFGVLTLHDDDAILGQRHSPRLILHGPERTEHEGKKRRMRSGKKEERVRERKTYTHTFTQAHAHIDPASLRHGVLLRACIL